MAARASALALRALLLGAPPAAAASAVAAHAYTGPLVVNEPTTLLRSAPGCECECAYLGGMCRASPEPACCMDLCCGGGAEFSAPGVVVARSMLQGASAPSTAVAAVAAEPYSAGIAQPRGMLQVAGDHFAQAMSNSIGADYNRVATLFTSERGCDCECSYLGGMCRSESDAACCQDVCCGAAAAFPMLDDAPPRAMLQGPGVALEKREPTTVTETKTRTSTVTHTKTKTRTITSTRTSSTSTRTSTSTTVTSTSTSTTTPYCAEFGTSWHPLMEGEDPSHEEDSVACQERCANTTGCAHYTYFPPSSLCTLHDAFAARMPGLPDMISGPFLCWSLVDHTRFLKTRAGLILPKEFGCIEPGVGYAPGTVVQEQLQGSRAEVVRQCRQRCVDAHGCQHFTVTWPSVCHLAEAGATLIPGMAASVSGNIGEACDARDELVRDVSELIVRKSALPSPALQFGNAGVTLLATVAVIITAAFAVAFGLVALYRASSRRRRGVRAPSAADAALLQNLDVDLEVPSE